MRIWTSTTSPNTTGVTHMPRRRQPIITGEARRAATGRSLLAGGTTRAQRGLGVRYQNRLLQLERPSRPRVPAKSRVLVRENQAGELAIHYRDHGLVFREWKAASTSLGEGRGVAPSPAPPSPKPKSCIPAADHPWRRNRYQQMKTPIFSTAW